jgi:hypothetical protein
VGILGVEEGEEAVALIQVQVEQVEQVVMVEYMFSLGNLKYIVDRRM